MPAFDEWQREVRLRLPEDGSSTLGRFVAACTQEGRFVVENTARAVAELARHMLVLQDAFLLSHDNLSAQVDHCGSEVETLSGVAQSLHANVCALATGLQAKTTESAESNAALRVDMIGLQDKVTSSELERVAEAAAQRELLEAKGQEVSARICLLYTSDAADE